jgi:hypothetical protein
MTDKEIIISTLERYYEVSTNDSNYVIKDIQLGKTHDTKSFVSIFVSILGSYTTDSGVSSISIYNEWLYDKKHIISRDINSFLQNMEYSKGSIILLEEITKCFKTDIRFTSRFISNVFNEYYSDIVLKPKLLDTFKTLDLKKSSKALLSDLDKLYIKDSIMHKLIVYSNFNDYYSQYALIPKMDEYINDFKTPIISSSHLVDKFQFVYINETSHQYDYSVKYLNKWYFDNILGGKLKDLLSQLVITMGKYDWIVTWVGHGPFYADSLRHYFKSENDYQFTHIEGIYQEWYENEIIEASERYVKKNSAFKPENIPMFRIWEDENLNL